MNNEELAQYIKENSKVEDLFMDKCVEYLDGKNQKRQPAKRWNETRIQRQAEKMYASLIENVQNKLAAQLRSKKVDVKQAWITFINENEVLDGLEESMGELEFG